MFPTSILQSKIRVCGAQRSNESPSGAFKRQNGLRQQMEGPRPDKFADVYTSALLAICKLYGTSADYLLGLTDYDPSDKARIQRQRLTEEEQNEMHRYEEYLLWKRKK